MHFPTLHADTGNRARRFLRHGAAAAFAAHEAARTGIRQQVQAVMTPRGVVWEVTPTS